MVNIIENWVHVKGRVTGIKSHPKLAGYNAIDIDVTEKKPHKNFPDLLPSKSANDVTINLKGTITKDLQLKEGDTIQGLVRAAGPDTYFFREDNVKVL